MLPEVGPGTALCGVPIESFEKPKQINKKLKQLISAKGAHFARQIMNQNHRSTGTPGRCPAVARPCPDVARPCPV